MCSCDQSPVQYNSLCHSLVGSKWGMGGLNDCVKQCYVTAFHGKHTFTRVSISKQPVAQLTVTGIASNAVLAYLLAVSVI